MGLQNGVSPPQLALLRHCTQVFVGLQYGAVVGQSVLLVHCTHV